MDKIVEDKVRKKLILNLSWQLVKQSFLLLVINCLKFVGFPPKFEVFFDSLLQILINVLILIISFHETEEFSEIVTVVDLPVQPLVIFQHWDELAHYVWEDNYSSHKNDWAE